MEPPADVAIIGLGPYGLAAAAYLRAQGVEPVAFGKPMSFWERSMPAGMLLRSSPRSSSIANPSRELSLSGYERANATTLPSSLTLDAFIEYGHWFRRQVLPEVDGRTVVRVEREASGFSLLLEDGDKVRTRRVIVAAGIEPFAYRPPQFASVPDEYASHSSIVRDVETFRGRRVLVVGAGQSALEDTALLHEAGAEVELVARKSAIRWLPLRAAATSASRGRVRLMDPPTDVGPPVVNWIAAMPDVLRRFPKSSRSDIESRCTPPMGAGWLVPRLRDVSLTLGHAVVKAEPSGGRVDIELDDGSRREVDHVVLATGYRVDVAKYAFLGPELVGALKLVGGYPRLTTGLESSVRGLHFVGAPAAASFGPLMRFVTGGWYCGPAVAREIAGKPPRPLQFAF